MTEPIEIQSSSQLPAIKLQFARGLDRWEHRLILLSEDSEIAIMTSIEGTPDQRLPASAPLQEASRHCLESGEAILCVGMAGKNHWSASFSVEQDGPVGLIKSDLACLQKSIAPVEKLGSTYALSLHCQVQSCSEKCIELKLNQNAIFISALSTNEVETKIELKDRHVWIRPSQISIEPSIPTRWGFMIEHKTDQTTAISDHESTVQY